MAIKGKNIQTKNNKTKNKVPKTNKNIRQTRRMQRIKKLIILPEREYSPNIGLKRFTNSIFKPKK